MLDLRDFTEFLRDCSSYIVSIIVLILVFTFIVAFQPVAGNSMNPTLKEGEVVLVSKIFKNNHYRNQIVVLNVNGKSYVKRIIGLPGENIEFMNGILFINGEAYKETFIDSTIRTGNFLFEDICDIDTCPDKKIPDDMYLVLGDNREESLDSRDKSFGLISGSQIDGNVFFRVWPINRFGNVK